MIKSNVIIKFCFGLLLLMFLWSGYGSIYANNNAYLSDESYHKSIRVERGDSLWVIAAKYADKKEDIRNLVFAIKQINGLNGNAEIYPGQTIKVPLKNHSLNYSKLTK